MLNIKNVRSALMATASLPMIGASKLPAAAITMAGLDHEQVPPSITEGDTWDSAWRSNCDVYLTNDGGYGIGGTGKTGKHSVSSKLTSSSTHGNMAALSGRNVNTSLSYTYGSGLCDVGGTLYLIQTYITDKINFKFGTNQSNTRLLTNPWQILSRAKSARIAPGILYIIGVVTAGFRAGLQWHFHTTDNLLH